MAGKFITFEGVDGSGKTLQTQMLFDYCLQKGLDVIRLREPGGNPISEKIRDIIVDNANSEMFDITECLLFAASRAQTVNQIILPALCDGKIVLCDRFVDSSLVYQGIGRGLTVNTVEQINNFATCGLQPDVTFFLDVSPEEVLERKIRTEFADRMENQELSFHRKVYEGYKKLADIYPGRFISLNARLSPEEINHEIILAFEKLLAF